ncbi:MAG: hypothetical protein Q9222_002703 [Ikaeria aurantiellina]
MDAAPYEINDQTSSAPAFTDLHPPSTASSKGAASTSALPYEYHTDWEQGVGYVETNVSLYNEQKEAGKEADIQEARNFYSTSNPSTESALLFFANGWQTEAQSICHAVADLSRGGEPRALAGVGYSEDEQGVHPVSGLGGSFALAQDDGSDSKASSGGLGQ